MSASQSPAASTSALAMMPPTSLGKTMLVICQNCGVLGKHGWCKESFSSAKRIEIDNKVRILLEERKKQKLEEREKAKLEKREKARLEKREKHMICHNCGKQDLHRHCKRSFSSTERSDIDNQVRTFLEEQGLSKQIANVDSSELDMPEPPQAEHSDLPNSTQAASLPASGLFFTSPMQTAWVCDSSTS